MRLGYQCRHYDDKAAEVKQDTAVLSNELRQAASELDKLKAVRDARKLEVAAVTKALKSSKYYLVIVEGQDIYEQLVALPLSVLKYRDPV